MIPVNFSPLHGLILTLLSLSPVLARPNLCMHNPNQFNPKRNHYLISFSFNIKTPFQPAFRDPHTHTSPLFSLPHHCSQTHHPSITVYKTKPIIPQLIALRRVVRELVLGFSRINVRKERTELESPVVFQFTATTLGWRPRSRWYERTKRKPFEPRLRREGAKLEHLSHARRRMKGLGCNGDNLVRWRQVLVGYEVRRRSLARETRKRSDLGSCVLAGDTADGDWRRRRDLSPVEGRAVAARTSWGGMVKQRLGWCVGGQ
ncbi:hypothetical protein DEO72_LG5g1057 [Vigna unguiculata]|uniref:Uncharacterized protein n=1 Tax=Vigna unguiculata TaxID=3917 RepID=A0A4D6LWC9_VIGUN|nr:hypothetical protein DEO72_LG5g1057 [Vigna unguiculata]